MCISFDMEILLLAIYSAAKPTQATKHRQGMFTEILLESKRGRKRGRGIDGGQGIKMAGQTTGKDRQTTGKGNGQKQGTMFR